MANGNWDPVTGAGGSVGDKVDGPVHNTVNSMKMSYQIHLLVGELSCLMSDTFPSKMDCELFQEYTITWPLAKVSLTEKVVELANESMRATKILSRAMVD